MTKAELQLDLNAKGYGLRRTEIKDQPLGQNGSLYTVVELDQMYRDDYHGMSLDFVPVGQRADFKYMKHKAIKLGFLS